MEIIDPLKKESFVNLLLHWHKSNARDFPWRSDKDPFKVMISEIFLQKTKAENIVTVFNRFLSKYPTAESLSCASLNNLENELKEIGLYRQKSIKLQKLGVALIENNKGIIPSNLEDLMNLPGIGRYIGNAVLCFAFGYDVPLLDTNIGRIVQRVFSLEVSGEKRKKKEAWDVLSSLVPAGKSKQYNYALIDLGASLCKAKKPMHELCPLKEICNYYIIRQK
jgi:A/G-specific adenine glycosylase